MPKNYMDRERMAAMTDEEIERDALSDPDAQPIDDEVWRQMQQNMVVHRSKELVTIRLDSEVLEFFKEHGRGYQTRINNVLKAFVEQAKKADLERDHAAQ